MTHPPRSSGAAAGYFICSLLHCPRFSFGSLNILHRNGAPPNLGNSVHQAFRTVCGALPSSRQPTSRECSPSRGRPDATCETPESLWGKTAQPGSRVPAMDAALLSKAKHFPADLNRIPRDSCWVICSVPQFAWSSMGLSSCRCFVNAVDLPSKRSLFLALSAT